jgi:hypothetical protein
LERSNRRWKALALTACSALVLVLLLGFLAVTTARMRTMEAMRTERDALAKAVQAERAAAQATNPVTPRR